METTDQDWCRYGKAASWVQESRFVGFRRCPCRPSVAGFPQECHLLVPVSPGGSSTYETPCPPPSYSRGRCATADEALDPMTWRWCGATRGGGPSWRALGWTRGALRRVAMRGRRAQFAHNEKRRLEGAAWFQSTEWGQTVYARQGSVVCIP